MTADSLSRGDKQGAMAVPAPPFSHLARLTDDTGLFEHFSGLGCAARWIHASRVGDNLQQRLIPKNGSEPLQDIQEIRGISRLGIVLLLQRQDRHGQLGQVVER